MRAGGGDFEGGIGEPLIVTDHVPATDTYHFLAYDGNGIVTGLVQSSGALGFAVLTAGLCQGLRSW